MLRIQQVSAGSAGSLSHTKAGLQCGGKHTLLRAAIFWVASGLDRETDSDLVTNRKKKFPRISYFPLPQTDLFYERATELDAVALSRYGSREKEIFY